MISRITIQLDSKNTTHILKRRKTAYFSEVFWDLVAVVEF